MPITQLEIEQRVLSSAYFDKHETRRIYQKYFTHPSRTTHVLLDKYGLGEKRVLEVGSAYGYDLIRFGEGSIGLDVRTVFQEFGASIGLDIRMANVEDTLPNFDRPFEVVYCSNLVEHVVAPHLLLMRFRELLTDDGLLCIKVPITPANWVWKLYQLRGIDHGFDNTQHVNFFTPNTIAWTIERSGYEVIGKHSPLLATRSRWEWLSSVLLPYLPSVLVVARKIPNYRYDIERIAEYNPPYAEDLLPYYKA